MIKYDEVDKRDRDSESKRFAYISVWLWFLIVMAIATPGIIVIEVNAFEIENIDKIEEHLLGMCLTISIIVGSWITASNYRYIVNNKINTY